MIISRLACMQPNSTHKLVALRLGRILSLCQTEFGRCDVVLSGALVFDDMRMLRHLFVCCDGSHSLYTFDGKGAISGHGQLDGVGELICGMQGRVGRIVQRTASRHVYRAAAEGLLWLAFASSCSCLLICFALSQPSAWATAFCAAKNAGCTRAFAQPPGETVSLTREEFGEALQAPKVVSEACAVAVTVRAVSASVSLREGEIEGWVWQKV